MGDGKNIPDIIRCALRKGDLACVRNGSGLHEYFRTRVEEQTRARATFSRWTSGLEILLELDKRGSCYEACDLFDSHSCSFDLKLVSFNFLLLTCFVICIPISNVKFVC